MIFAAGSLKKIKMIMFAALTETNALVLEQTIAAGCFVCWGALFEVASSCGAACCTKHISEPTVLDQWCCSELGGGFSGGKQLAPQLGRIRLTCEHELYGFG